MKAPSLARLHRLVDPLVRNDGQLLKLVQQRFELLCLSRLFFVVQKLGGVGKHRVQIDQSLHRVMRFLGQHHLVLRPKQPINESFELLRAQPGQIVQSLAGRPHVESRQAKGVAQGLVVGEPVPQALHKNPDHVLDLVLRGENGHLTVPDLRQCAQGRDVQAGTGDGAHEQ
jgi:hypothetical protein